MNPFGHNSKKNYNDFIEELIKLHVFYNRINSFKEACVKKIKEYVQNNLAPIKVLAQLVNTVKDPIQLEKAEAELKAEIVKFNDQFAPFVELKTTAQVYELVYNPIFFRNDPSLTDIRLLLNSFLERRGGNIFLMPSQNPDTYQNSDSNNLYLYKNKEGQIIYKLGKKTFELLDEKTQKPEVIQVIKNLNFNPRKPVKCLDLKVQMTILAMLSNQGMPILNKHENFQKFMEPFLKEWNDIIYVGILTGKPQFELRVEVFDPVYQAMILAKKFFSHTKFLQWDFFEMNNKVNIEKIIYDYENLSQTIVNAQTISTRDFLAEDEPEQKQEQKPEQKTFLQHMEEMQKLAAEQAAREKAAAEQLKRQFEEEKVASEKLNAEKKATKEKEAKAKSARLDILKVLVNAYEVVPDIKTFLPKELKTATSEDVRASLQKLKQQTPKFYQEAHQAVIQHVVTSPSARLSKQMSALNAMDTPNLGLKELVKISDFKVKIWAAFHLALKDIDIDKVDIITLTQELTKSPAWQFIASFDFANPKPILEVILGYDQLRQELAEKKDLSSNKDQQKLETLARWDKTYEEWQRSWKYILPKIPEYHQNVDSLEHELDQAESKLTPEIYNDLILRLGEVKEHLDNLRLEKLINNYQIKNFGDCNRQIREILKASNLDQVINNGLLFIRNSIKEALVKHALTEKSKTSPGMFGPGEQKKDRENPQDKKKGQTPTS